MLDGSPTASLRVLLTKGRLKGTWVAISLERYIAAQGTSPVDALREFKHMLAAAFIYGIEHGNADHPLEGIAPAPTKYWDMFDKAEPFDPPTMTAEFTIVKADEDLPTPAIPSMPSVEQLRLAA